MISFFVKVQINKLRKLNQCDMKDIGAVSSLASKMGMTALVTFLYTNADEYLRYIQKSESN